MANWFWQRMRKALGHETVEEQWDRIGGIMDEVRARIDARSPNSEAHLQKWKNENHTPEA
jgi:hypothetical protein